MPNNRVKEYSKFQKTKIGWIELDKIMKDKLVDKLLDHNSSYNVKKNVLAQLLVSLKSKLSQHMSIYEVNDSKPYKTLCDLFSKEASIIMSKNFLNLWNSYSIYASKKASNCLNH